MDVATVTVRRRDDEAERERRHKLCGDNVVERSDGIVRMWAWHPQWGGYAAHCHVETCGQGVKGDAMGCFDVTVWHDGEFPCDHPQQLHYCDPMQVVEFGVKVAALQCSEAKSGPSDAEKDDIRECIKLLEGLLLDD